MKKLKRLPTTSTHLTSVQVPVPKYTELMSEEVDAITTTEEVKTEFNSCLEPIAVPLTPVVSQLQINNTSSQQLNNNDLVLQYSNATNSTSMTPNDNNTLLKQGTTFTSHTDFVVAVQEYSTRNGFTMRLNTVKRNREGVVRWREIVCSRSGTPSSKKSGIKPIRNRPSQRCDCPFLIRASINAATGLWEIIATNFDHNHEINNNDLATTANNNENDSVGTVSFVPQSDYH
ncbi:hypothetical protein RclHR1_03300012 [Rhizophagus clarus]|uniref:Protein FAR1-related sequence 5-like n=1 Tax=Rhizophagus clarus TaxID=94130 RepID=A0A2Z6RCP8_9GLOM|nr:hypothetical protein RclHR1_03300012 [Rhizophagus clarus]GES77095.1 protein FAR1-related sequence 5-like [Rhizophagus clarus]